MAPTVSLFADNSTRVKFEKTLALFSVLSEKKCSFKVSNEAVQSNHHVLHSDSDSDSDSDVDSASDVDTDMDALSMDDTPSNSYRLGSHANFDRVLHHFTTSRRRPLLHAVCEGKVVLRKGRYASWLLQYVIFFYSLYSLSTFPDANIEHFGIDRTLSSTTSRSTI